MDKFKRAMVALWKEEDGLTTVEYAIAGGLVGATLIFSFTELGRVVGEIINFIVLQLDPIA